MRPISSSTSAAHLSKHEDVASTTSTSPSISCKTPRSCDFLSAGGEQEKKGASEPILSFFWCVWDGFYNVCVGIARFVANLFGLSLEAIEEEEIYQEGDSLLAYYGRQIVSQAIQSPDEQALERLYKEITEKLKKPKVFDTLQQKLKEMLKAEIADMQFELKQLEPPLNRALQSLCQGLATHVATSSNKSDGGVLSLKDDLERALEPTHEQWQEIISEAVNLIGKKNPVRGFFVMYYKIVLGKEKEHSLPLRQLFDMPSVLGISPLDEKAISTLWRGFIEKFLSNIVLSDEVKKDIPAKKTIFGFALKQSGSIFKGHAEGNEKKIAGFFRGCEKVAELFEWIRDQDEKNLEA